MPVIQFGGNRVFISDDSAADRLHELSSRAGQLDDRERNELGALQEWRSRHDYLVNLAGNPAARAPGTDQGSGYALGAESARTGIPEHRLAARNAEMGREPLAVLKHGLEPVTSRARSLLEAAHSRSEGRFDDGQAAKLDSFLKAGPAGSRGTFSEYLAATSLESGYQEAFGQILLDPHRAQFGLTDRARDALNRGREAQRALAEGYPGAFTSGSYPVPFQLDPTVILSSQGGQSPMRQIARVEQVIGKAWLGVTSTGTVAVRGDGSTGSGEGVEASDGAPTLIQPEVAAQRVSCFVPFSVEVEQDWNGLLAEISAMIADAKMVEEASAFVTGTGADPAHAGGVVGSLSTTPVVKSATTSVIALGDVQGLESQLSPRWRPGSKFLMSHAMANYLRRCQVVLGTPALTGLTDGEMTLMGRSAWAASAMDSGVTFVDGAITGSTDVQANQAVGVSGQKILLQGDFRQFIIVDRIASLSVELVPHLFGTDNNFPTGQRGIWAMWRSNSMVLVEDAFRLLEVK